MQDRRALRSVAVQFFVNGALFASFIPRLPEIRDRVGISVGGIGVILAIAGASGLVASATVGSAITRFGTRKVMIGAGVMVSASLPLVGLATTPVVLLLGLVGMFVFDVFVDVAMNLQASWISERRHAPVINRLHSLWSLGTMVGGVASSRIASAGVPIAVHLMAAGVLLLAVLGYVGPGLLGDDQTSRPSVPSGAPIETSGRFAPIPILFLFAGFFALALESVSTEWAAFRLTDDFGSTPGFAALAFVAVTVGMTIGRFAGDWATVVLGAQRLNRLSIALSGIGFALAALWPNPYVALLGFSVAGLGIATLLPVLYDTAAKYPGKAGVGLGALTAGMRAAGLTVPLIVGTLASTDLSVGSAIAVVALPSVVGFAAITAVFDRRTTPNGED